MLAQEIYSAVIFAFLICLAILSNYFLHHLDVTPQLDWQMSSWSTNYKSFIAERAYKHLKTLNDYGPKVVGSEANEKLAFEYILNQVTEIQNSKPNNHSDITIDYQAVSGVNFGDAIYKNIQNIVVKVQGITNHAVLLNCHYDSVPGSPGASDDAVMCCVMIEILRVLSRNKDQEKHSIIFLFNGAEEIELQGSHGFITQHKYAKDVRAYINLESTGSGGREMLFRSGPKHDWLIRMYRQAAKHPFGQGVAEELFETGVIPSATDFQIFRDDGGIPGLDFAYVEEGFRYHTRYDNINYITLESIQNTGENIYELMRKMANSDELANPPEGSSAVYFDYLGLFFVSYSAGVGYILNIIISLLAVIVPFVAQVEFKMKNLMSVTVGTLISFLTIIISMALAAGFCYGMAEIMNAVDNSMSWFNSMFLSIGIYGSLALLVQLAFYHIVHFIMQKFFSKKNEKNSNGISSRRRLQVELNGINLFWAVLTLTVTFMGYRFGYITMVILFLTLCTNILMYLLYKFAPKTRYHGWIALHLLGQTFIVMWMSYLVQQSWELFTPITAKQYYENPDTMIGLICAFWMIGCFSYILPLTKLVPKKVMLYSILIATFVVSLILSFTSAGFPYSDNDMAPRVQRHRVVHTKRTFYDNTGAVKYSDVGCVIAEYDRNAQRTLESIFDPNDLKSLDSDPMCDKESFCGFPVFRFGRSKWYDGITEEPILVPTAVLHQNVIRDTVNASQIKFEFSLDMNTMTYLYITPGVGWNLKNKNIDMGNYSWNDGLVYITLITYGKKTDELMEVSIDLEGTSTADKNNVMTLTVVTLAPMLKPNYKVLQFSNLLDKFPSWTHIREEQAQVESYIFKEN